MRNNLRPSDKALRLVSSVQPLAEKLADAEFLNDRPGQIQFGQAPPADVSDGPRWMPASAIALAGGISLLLWGLLVGWLIHL
jgi:hypothetical protein